MSKKLAVILVSKSGCKKQHWSILEDILRDGVDIFCAVGVDCELWEDLMDETIVGDGSIERERHIATTSHPGENFEKVKQFAIDFFPKADVILKVVEI